MRPTSELVADAREMSAERFRALHGDLFLLKRPTLADAIWDGEHQFKTVQGSPSEVSRRAKIELHASLEMVAPVKKKPDNPFPRMISIGRARSCDIAIRLPNVSKLHASINLADDGKLSVRDHGSVNGTTLNGARVRDAMVPIRVGDRLALGGVICDLVDAETLIERLRAAADAG